MRTIQLLETRMAFSVRIQEQAGGCEPVAFPSRRATQQAPGAAVQEPVGGEHVSQASGRGSVDVSLSPTPAVYKLPEM